MIISIKFEQVVVSIWDGKTNRADRAFEHTMDLVSNQCGPKRRIVKNVGEVILGLPRCFQAKGASDKQH